MNIQDNFHALIKKLKVKHREDPREPPGHSEEKGSQSGVSEGVQRNQSIYSRSHWTRGLSNPKRQIQLRDEFKAPAPVISKKQKQIKDLSGILNFLKSNSLEKTVGKLCSFESSSLLKGEWSRIVKPLGLSLIERAQILTKIVTQKNL